MNIIAECCMDEGGPRAARHAWEEAKARDPKITLRAVAGFLREHRGMVGGAKEVEYGPKRQVGRPKKPKPPEKARKKKPTKAEEDAKVRKEQVIEEAYNNYVNMGRVGKTYESAKLKDPTITRKDVQDWKDKNVVPLKNHRGTNSFVAKEPREEYQLDLMFFDDLKERDEETGKKKEEDYNAAVLMVDIFTKYCWVAPVRSKKPADVLEGIKECIKELGGFPKMIYCDQEAAFIAPGTVSYLSRNGTQVITTLTHAPVAERTIRTIKGLLYPRVRARKTKWWEQLPYVLDVYNKHDKHRSTGLTPEDATKAENKDDVRLSLELNRKTGRKYPPVKRGDRVRLYRKKQKGEKENVPYWSDHTYAVTGVHTEYAKKHKGNPIKVYAVNRKTEMPFGKEKKLLRHEIFKVPN